MLSVRFSSRLTIPRKEIPQWIPLEGIYGLLGGENSPGLTCYILKWGMKVKTQAMLEHRGQGSEVFPWSIKPNLEVGGKTKVIDLLIQTNFRNSILFAFLHLT